VRRDVLVVLFGHVNDGSVLRSIAKSRCDAATSLVHKIPDAMVLPTGGFGRHFNTTERPHSHYLTEYLIREGVPHNRILPGTDSSDTFEDCLCARKVALDNNVGEVIGVTSEYHAPRVRFVMEAILRGIRFSVHEAPTPAEVLCGESREESRRFARLRREWVTPVLYERGQSFPDSVYQAAGNDQRHYDTLSLAIVTAIVAISLFPLLVISGPLNELTKASSCFGVGLIQFLMLGAYERLVEMARVGRRTLRAIEIGFGSRGFSANYSPETLFRSGSLSRRNLMGTLTLQHIVRTLSVMLIAVNFLVGTMVGAGGLR